MQNPPLIRPDMYNQGSSSMATYNASEKNLNEHPSPQIAQPSTSQKLPYRINPTTTMVTPTYLLTAILSSLLCQT
ncbi:AP-1-like transcription factor YAP6 [Saccharomyces cerevisiae]|nr:AP-1-like transcription factor YAP6 [Saccharomyces cerevisiae]